MYIVNVKNAGKIGIASEYENESDDEQQIYSQLNSYECAMHHDFEFYNIYAESAEIGKWSILNTKIDLAECNRRE